MADEAVTRRNQHKEEKEETKAIEKIGDGKEMTPWEQHSSVITLPRFDYNAPSSLLHHWPIPAGSGAENKIDDRASAAENAHAKRRTVDG
ncbi:hypothetical protein SESBI_13132 [Sesbania bispinosa]|nr:hypothetical protein SESBI_13132 [Sesbania bispinosa]